MLRCQYPSFCQSVRLSVTDVHWRIIANLGFNSDPNLSRIVVAGRGNLDNNISHYASHCYALLLLVQKTFILTYFIFGNSNVQNEYTTHIDVVRFCAK